MQEEASTSKNNVRSKRVQRYFSESARRSIVEEIEQGLSKAEAARKYQVSEASVYKWIAKYSACYQSMLVQVVEHASDSNKVKQLEAQVEQTYAMLGRVKAECLLLETIIEKANEALKTDLKKSFAAQPLSLCTTKRTKSK